MFDQERILSWMQRRMMHSQLMEHYFELRELGLDPKFGADAIGDLVFKFLAGSCAFFASVIARKIGREHMIAFRRGDNGDLLHAVVACAQQYHAVPLRGSYVDVLGRAKLQDLEREMREIFGDIVVSVGDLVDADEYGPGEENVLERLASVLPWTRGFVGGSIALERDPNLFLKGIHDACECRSVQKHDIRRA